MANLQHSIRPVAPGIVAPVSAPTAVTRRLSLISLIFSFTSVVFFLLLVFLRFPFPLYPLMSWQDALDLLTPLVLIPIYWLMFRMITQNRARLSGEVFFMVFAAFWIAGQGMHLSANSVNNMSENLAKQQTLDILATDIYRLTYFYDEVLSHYLWHIGVLGLAALLMYAAWRSTLEEKTDWRLVIPAVILYAVNCFCIFVEGQTAPLSFPAMGVLSLLSLSFGRKKLSSEPVLAFFTFAFLIAFLAVAGWSLYHWTFPPPELMK